MLAGFPSYASFAAKKPFQACTAGKSTVEFPLTQIRGPRRFNRDVVEPKWQC